MSRNRSDDRGRIIIGRALSHRAGCARSLILIVQWDFVSDDRPGEETRRILSRVSLAFPLERGIGFFQTSQYSVLNES